MGLVYDVWYLDHKDFDTGVGDRYLQLMADRVRSGDRSLVGAVAVVKNGAQESYTLGSSGAWLLDANPRR